MLIKNIYFDVEYSFFENEFKIISFRLNDFNEVENNFILDLLDEYNKSNEIKNWIDLKSFINKIIITYDE